MKIFTGSKKFKERHPFLTTVLFFILLLFSSSGFAESPADTEINELKEQLKQANEQLKQAQEYISKLTTRVEAIEAKVAEETPAGETDSLQKSKKDEKLQVSEKPKPAEALRPRYAHDLEEAVIESSETDENLISKGGQLPGEGFKHFAEGFSFHGYLRSGYGLNSKGGRQIAFQAPGAPSKYRLGNETETYGELFFAQEFNLDEEGPLFDVNVRLAFKTLQNKGSDPSNDEFSVREAYARMGNFDWAPGVKFWAGERFYQRHDIHIIDYYFLDTSGYGGGVEDINLFDRGKLSLAYLGGSSDDFQLNNIGSVAKNSFDIRVSDVEVPLGQGTVWLFPSFVKGGTYQNSAGESELYNSSEGLAVGLMHTAVNPFGMRGYNKLSVQYGTGTSADFNTNIQNPDPKIKDRTTFQVTESGVIQPWDYFAAMYTLVYKRENNGASSDNILDWFSAGARPMYFLNKHVALALEAGADHVNSRIDNYSDTLFKISFAPELRIDNTFMGRPVLRAYATYAVWGNDFEGKVGGSTYQNDKDGLALGVQMEAWW